MKTKMIMIPVRFEKAEAEAIARFAAADERSRSLFVRRIVVEWLRELDAKP